MKIEGNSVCNLMSREKGLAGLVATMVLLTACSTPPHETNGPVVSAAAVAQPANRTSSAKTAPLPTPPATNAPVAGTEEMAPGAPDRAEDPNLPQLLSRDSSARRSGILSFRDTWKSRITSGYYDDAMSRVSTFAPYVYYDHQHINMLDTMLR